MISLEYFWLGNHFFLLKTNRLFDKIIREIFDFVVLKFK